MNDSLAGALENARCREEAARAYYDELSGSDKANGWASLLRDHAHDAAMNVEIIEKTLEGLRQGERVALPDLVRACEYDPELANSVRPGLAYRQLTAASDPKDVVVLAMRREEALLRHYASEIGQMAGRPAQFYRYLAERSGRRLETLRARAETKL